MFHPSRGGVRGGRDQFNWEDVKNDKFRENFLGHSVMAPVGRWQKGKDLTWYAKDKKTQQQQQQEEELRRERERIKQDEEDAMNELLGLAPRKRKDAHHGSRLDSREMQQLFERGHSGEAISETYKEGERIQGLGFSQAPGHEERVARIKQQLQQQIAAKEKAGGSGGKEAGDGGEGSEKEAEDVRRIKEKPSQEESSDDDDSETDTEAGTADGSRKSGGKESSSVKDHEKERKKKKKKKRESKGDGERISVKRQRREAKEEKRARKKARREEKRKRAEQAEKERERRAASSDLDREVRYKNSGEEPERKGHRRSFEEMFQNGAFDAEKLRQKRQWAQKDETRKKDREMYNNLHKEYK